MGLLKRRGELLQVAPQNLVEFWVVATLPLPQNGLGMDPLAAKSELERIKAMFVLLPEVSEVYTVWEYLVLEYCVVGKPAHDARLVAAMKVHGISSILTFDRTGFSRYEGVKVIDPAEVVS